MLRTWRGVWRPLRSKRPGGGEVRGSSDRSCEWESDRMVRMYRYVWAARGTAIMVGCHSSTSYSSRVLGLVVFWGREKTKRNKLEIGSRKIH